MEVVSVIPIVIVIFLIIGEVGMATAPCLPLRVKVEIRDDINSNFRWFLYIYMVFPYNQCIFVLYKKKKDGNFL